jgi:hypothetical protein
MRRLVDIALVVWGLFWLALIVFVVWALLSPAPPHSNDPRYKVPTACEGWTKAAQKGARCER